MAQIVEEIEASEQDNKKAEIELALKEFGLELRRIRESKNLNQRELHEITGIDKSVLSELERGLYTPSLAIIKQLADGLDVNPHILVASYYGMPIPEFSLKDKETLESFIKLALDYVAPKAAELLPFQSATPTEQITERGLKGLKEGVAENRRRSAARRKNKTPTETNPDNIEK